MPTSITCPGCHSTLQLRPEYAGKKIRCPKCQEVLTVPVDAEEDEPLDVTPADEAFTATKPARETVPPARKKRASRRDEEDEDEDDRDDGPRYVPCPRCGARGPERVLWTPWGSFYGPALFTHVRCRKCDYTYNGNSGGSNLIPAIIFVTIPALLLLGVIGFIVYMFMNMR